MAALTINGAAGWLKRKLQTASPDTVTYTRGVNSITLGRDGQPLKAIIGQRRNREESQGDARLILDGEPMDFLIDPADLLISGSTITPASGDRITWEGRTYDVRPTDGEPAQRSSDPWENLLRVHTIRKS